MNGLFGCAWCMFSVLSYIFEVMVISVVLLLDSATGQLIDRQEFEGGD
jgi:hypothetical protein